MSVSPKKRLGQHFLVDENILRVIERLGELGPEDVVLEIGPGLGALTTFLADRVALVQAIEIDRALEPALSAPLAGRSNVELHFGDALRVDLGSLAPPPGKLVSNLPYKVAVPIVIESLERLPTVQLWCVMVQREIGDRFFAAPGTKAYGAVSVLLQLSSQRTGFHPVSRNVFRPRPRVDSALVAFRRVASVGSYARVKQLVETAFRHRRKTLPNALELAGLATRSQAAAALEALGRTPTARAEELTPHEFAQLGELLA